MLVYFVYEPQLEFSALLNKKKKRKEILMLAFFFFLVNEESWRVLFSAY